MLDFEALADPEPTYTFTVEAVDAEGTMPPGLASVTVRITVSGAFMSLFEDGKSGFSVTLLVNCVFSLKGS